MRRAVIVNRTPIIIPNANDMLHLLFIYVKCVAHAFGRIWKVAFGCPVLAVCICSTKLASELTQIDE